MFKFFLFIQVNDPLALQLLYADVRMSNKFLLMWAIIR